MARRIQRIDDFSGGMRGGFAAKRNANECASMSNYWCQGISLKPIRSHKALTNSPTFGSTDTASKFKRHYKYVDSSGNKYLIAKQGSTIWIGTPSTTDWTTTTTINWKPLLGDVRVNGNIFYHARPLNAKESMTSVGALLYMACEDPTQYDVVYRYDGYIHSTGTIKFDTDSGTGGVDSTGRGIYKHVTAYYDFEAAGVKAGDIIYFYDHSTSKWRVGTDAGVSNGYVIAGVGYEGAVVTGGTPVLNIGFTNGLVRPPDPGMVLRATLELPTDTNDYAWQYEGPATWVDLCTLANKIVVKAQAATKIQFSINGVFYVLNGTAEAHTGSWGIELNTWDGFVFDTEAHSDDYYAAVGGVGFDGLSYITVQTSALNQCWDTTDKGAGGVGDHYVNYVIVRIKEAGIEAPPDCTASAYADAASVLAAGTYTYCYRYKDSITGYTSKMSTPSAAVTTTALQSVRMQGWATRPDDPVDILQIFRSSGALYYLVQEVDRKTGYGTNYLESFSSTGEDNGWAIIKDSSGNNISAETNAFLRDRPGVMRYIRNFAGRLVGFNYGDNAHKFKISSLYNYEYFPSTDWTLDIDTLLYNTDGGEFQIGANKHEPLTGMIAEGGAYQTTGITGDNLLLFTSSNAYRFFGTNWGNYQIVNAFAKGCIAGDSIVNANGIIIWVDQNHVLAVPSGSNYPETVSSNIFPLGIQSEMTTASPLLTMQDWCACFWNNCYFLSLTLTGSTNDTTYVMDLSSKAWFTFNYGANDFIVWDNPSSADKFIMTISDAETNDSIVALFADSATKVTSTWESGSMPIGGVLKDAIHIQRLSIKAHGALTSSTIKVSIYDSTYPLVLWSETIAIPDKDNSARGYEYQNLFPHADAIEPSIHIESSSLPQLTIEAIEIEFEAHGDGDTLKQS